MDTKIKWIYDEYNSQKDTREPNEHTANTHTQARNIQQRTYTFVCTFVHINLVTCLCLSACAYVCVLCWLITASAIRSVLVGGMTVWKKRRENQKLEWPALIVHSHSYCCLAFAHANCKYFDYCASVANWIFDCSLLCEWNNFARTNSCCCCRCLVIFVFLSSFSSLFSFWQNNMAQGVFDHFSAAACLPCITSCFVHKAKTFHTIPHVRVV